VQVVVCAHAGDFFVRPQFGLVVRYRHQRQTVREIAVNGEAMGIPAAKFMTVAEVAATLRVSKMTVYRLIGSRTLRAVRFGRSYRVPESEMEPYVELASLQDAPTPEPGI
jgi:excisionase family DNA binding protein